MATTLVFLPGKSPWTKEPGRLQSMGSEIVGNDYTTKYILCTFSHTMRKRKFNFLLHGYVSLTSLWFW